MSQFVNLAKDSTNTQENLNPQNSVNPILKRHREDLLIEECSSIYYNNDTANMAIWDNPDTTWDGGATNDEWDSYSDNKAIVKVTNPSNKYIERFGFETLKNASTTATWSTSNKNVTFTSGQVLVIQNAYYDDNFEKTITTATLSVTIDSGSFDLEMSADGGSNWESVSNNVSHTFTNTGSDLRIRITENAASTGTISLVTCQYTLQDTYITTGTLFTQNGTWNNTASAFDGDSTTYSGTTSGNGVSFGLTFSAVTVKRLRIKATFSDTGGSPSRSITVQTYNGTSWSGAGTLVSGRSEMSYDGVLTLNSNIQGVLIQFAVGGSPSATDFRIYRFEYEI